MRQWFSVSWCYYNTNQETDRIVLLQHFSYIHLNQQLNITVKADEWLVSSAIEIQTDVTIRENDELSQPFRFQQWVKLS